MKTVFAIFLTVFLVVATQHRIKAADESSVPPGISAEAWLPIGETAGFVISSSGMSTQKDASGQVVRGYFFAKKNGTWFRLDAVPMPSIFNAK